METSIEEVKNNTATNSVGMDMEITSNTMENNEKMQIENSPMDGKHELASVVNGDGNGSEKENADMEDDITINEEELDRLKLVYKKGVEEGVEEEKSRLKMEEKRRSEEEQKWKNGMQSVLVKVQQELEQMKQKTHETQKEPMKMTPIETGSTIETIVSCASNGSNKPSTDKLSFLSLDKENKKLKEKLKKHYKNKYKENQKKMNKDVNYSSKDDSSKRKFEKVDDYNAKILSFLNTNKKPMVEVNMSSKNSKNIRYDEKQMMNNDSIRKVNNNDSLQNYNRNEELNKIHINKYGGCSEFYNLVYNSKKLSSAFIESGENNKVSLSGYPRDNRSYLMNSIEVSSASLKGNNKQSQNNLAPMNALYNWVRTGDDTPFKKVSF